MASVNRVALLGNCGKDPEIRYLPSDSAVATVSLATTSKRKDKNTGEYTEETQWHRLQAFDKLAEIFGEYVKKGSPIYVEGRIKYGKYTDKDGVERNTTDIVVDSMQLLGSRDKTDKPQASPAVARQTPPAARPSGSGFDDMDDDIQF